MCSHPPFQLACLNENLTTIKRIRFMLRLALLRVTGRPLVFPPLPEREIELSTLADNDVTSKSPDVPKHPFKTPDHLKNNHSLFPRSAASTPNPLLTSSTPYNSSVDDFLLSKALTPSSVCQPARLLTPLISPREWASELVHIARPLVYGKITHTKHSLLT